MGFFIVKRNYFPNAYQEALIHVTLKIMLATLNRNMNYIAKVDFRLKINFKNYYCVLKYLFANLVAVN